MSEVDDLEMIAITRDLARKPEIRFLASVLHTIATGVVEHDVMRMPPLYVRMAHRIITKPENRFILLHAIGSV